MILQVGLVRFANDYDMGACLSAWSTRATKDLEFSSLNPEPSAKPEMLPSAGLDMLTTSTSRGLNSLNPNPEP